MQPDLVFVSPLVQRLRGELGADATALIFSIVTADEIADLLASKWSRADAH